jgi:hypothetical protein
MKTDFTNDQEFLQHVPDDSTLEARALMAVFWNIYSFTDRDYLLTVPDNVALAIAQLNEQLTPKDFESVGEYLARASGLISPKDTPVTFHRVGMSTTKMLLDVFKQKLGTTFTKH